MQLVKGMFGDQFKRQGDLFGLACGQIRADRIVHNGGWYNRAGEKLGWGDLDHRDFLRISEEIRDDEIFVVLHEEESFRKFIAHDPGVIGSMCTTDPAADAPGEAYIAEHVRYIIGRNQIYMVDQKGTVNEAIFDHRGIRFTVVKKQNVGDFLGIVPA